MCVSVCECVCVCVSVCMSGYPAVPGLMAARLASLDDEFLSSFPLDGHWVAGLQDSIGELTTHTTSWTTTLSCTCCMKHVLDYYRPRR